MNGLNKHNAPDASVVIPHFIFGAIALILVSVMLIFANSELFAEYFGNKIVAITHMALLGWGTMIVFGALYQLIPVVFETALYSEKLAKFTFWITAFSVLFLTYSFWISNYIVLLPLAAVLMFVSLFLFILNIGMSYKKAQKKNVSSRFVVTAVAWLAVTELVGMLTALNFRFAFFEATHLHYLKIHAGLGMAGWFLMLIIGVGSVLIPMFLISHQLDHKKLERAYYLINSGLALVFINGFFLNYTMLDTVSWIFVSAGIGFFASFVYNSYKKRLRKVLDIGMKHTMIAVAAMIVPVVISGLIIRQGIFDDPLLMRVTVLYGFSVVFGLITTIILGQTYKTLPFIIWLQKYQSLVGKKKTPLPRELYSEKIAGLQFAVYMFFLAFMTAAFLSGSQILLKIGSYLLLIVAILYNINVFKIVMHQIKTEEL